MDAPRQSDPRSDSKKRAEDREKREGEKNEREREREVVRKQNCEEHPHADTRKKIEARTKHAMISQSSDVLLSCGGF